MTSLLSPVSSSHHKQTMKTIHSIYVLWLVFCVQSHGQLSLNAGESWAYQFDNLPKTGTVSTFGATPGGVFEFTVDSSTFQSGDMLRFEMFEHDTSEVPICSGVMTSAPPFIGSCETDAAWQDRQGAVRLIMISGSVTIDAITVKAITTGPSLSSYDVNSVTFAPVPEPEPMTLSLFAAAFYVTLRRSSRSSKNHVGTGWIQARAEMTRHDRPNGDSFMLVSSDSQRYARKPK